MTQMRMKKKRRKRLEQLPFEDRLKLLRSGSLSEVEVADLAADLGTGNHIEARAEVEKLLDHPSSIIRYNSLATLAYEWGLASRIDRITEIALNDPDRDCRRQAAGSLGSLFRGTKDRDVLPTLLSIIQNPREENDVRAFAYTAALDVIGVSRKIQPSALNLTIGSDELAALDAYLKAL